MERIFAIIGWSQKKQINAFQRWILLLFESTLEVARARYQNYASKEVTGTILKDISESTNY
jgi:hypothetical protein